MNRVLIVEDQKMAQENMEAIINSSENYSLSGIIPNAADAELFCMREKIDLILMDVCTMRDESGIEATAVIKKKFPKIKIIIVTSMAEHTFIEKAKKQGLIAFGIRMQVTVICSLLWIELWRVSIYFLIKRLKLSSDFPQVMNSRILN